MRRFRTKDGVLDVPINSAFQINGVKYPKNWLALTSEDERAAIGLEEYEGPDPAEPALGISDQSLKLLVEEQAGMIRKQSKTIDRLSGDLDSFNALNSTGPGESNG